MFDSQVGSMLYCWCRLAASSVYNK